MSLVCRAQHCSMMACTISQMIIWIINNNPALLAQSCKYIYSSSWRPSSAHSSRTPDTAYEASMIHDAVSSAGVGVVLWYFIMCLSERLFVTNRFYKCMKETRAEKQNFSYKYVVFHRQWIELASWRRNYLWRSGPDQTEKLQDRRVICCSVKLKIYSSQNLSIRLYWKRVIAQYRGWTVVFQICTMYTAFLDKEIFHQSPGTRSRWHWMHPLRCLCCSWWWAADLVLLCTKLRSCSSRQHSHTTDKYADQNRTST